MARRFISATLSSQFEKVNGILEAALDAVDPYLCTQKFIQLNAEKLKIGELPLSLNKIGHIYVLGTGKAVLPMTKAVCDRLGERLQGGVIIGKHPDAEIMAKIPSTIEVLFGDHPVPTEKSMQSAQKMANLTKKMTEKDLVICLISGGGSALMTLPRENIHLADMQEVTRQLLFSGATINEVNAVRKHLDRIKGGGLARMVWPAKLTTLVLSDVIGDSLDAIASGPTVADNSTFGDVLEIIEKYHLAGSLPGNVMNVIREGQAGKLPETVKNGEKYLDNAHTFIVGSLAFAIEAARKQAETSGFKATVVSGEVNGEASEIGRKFGSELRKLAEGRKVGKKPELLIAGGETTVTVKGQGKGGRNQETALSAALELNGCPDCLFISLATDGEDGPTDAAGGAVTGTTISQGESQGLDAENFLARNDAYNYLQSVDGLIKIGPTGTNVNDLIFAFVF
jgi:hydroxypyruvate reductase